MQMGAGCCETIRNILWGEGQCLFQLNKVKPWSTGQGGMGGQLGPLWGERSSCSGPQGSMGE